MAGLRVVNWDSYKYEHITITTQGIASALVEVVSRCSYIMFFITTGTFLYLVV